MTHLAPPKHPLTGVGVLISKKVAFNTHTRTHTREIRGAFNNGTKINPSESHKFKYVTPNNRALKIHEAKANRNIPFKSKS